MNKSQKTTVMHIFSIFGSLRMSYFILVCLVLYNWFGFAPCDCMQC